jgi:hypothetical protein
MPLSLNDHPPQKFRAAEEGDMGVIAQATCVKLRNDKRY